MKKLLNRVDRIRASGSATLNLEPGSPYYKRNGCKFKVHSMETPDYKCRITLIIDDQTVDFTINQVY